MVDDFNENLKIAERKAIKNHDVDFLTKVWFKLKPDEYNTPTQNDMIRAIIFKEHLRIIVAAFTRYGKSQSIGQAICGYILSNQDKKINIIAPLEEQSVILREYVGIYMSRCSKFQELIPKGLSKLDRLKEEFNKKRVTFRHPNNCRLRIFSAEGEGNRLMGWGADLVIVDQLEQIPNDVYTSKISRQLGDSPTSIFVGIINPKDKNHISHKFWLTPNPKLYEYDLNNFKKFHIDWRLGIKEGRITQEFVDSQRYGPGKLSKIDFDRLYEAVFPDDTEDTLIKWKWIKNALNAKFKCTEVVYGFDVAECGNDFNVLFKGARNPQGYYQLLHGWFTKEEMEPMQVASWAMRRIKGDVYNHYIEGGKENHLLNPDYKSNVFVDSTGVGSGPQSRLKEKGYNSVKIMFGASPTVKKKKSRDVGGDERNPDPDFLNFKSQSYWNMRRLFEYKKMNIFEIGSLISELNSLKYDHTSGEKVVILKPGDKTRDGVKVDSKSPDFATGLNLMTCGSLRREFGVVVL